MEDVYDTGEYETVYNVRVADFHTYFVAASESWGLGVWAHNAAYQTLHQEFPSVAMAPSGAFVVLWSGNGPGDGAGVFAQQFATAGIVVTPTSGLVTSESGAAANFTVVLATQPTANVTIGISSSNTNEGTVSVATLTFTPGNWNVAQTVTVTGVDDFVDDGNVNFAINTAAASSADANYNNVDAADVAVTNVDDDVAGINVSAISGTTTEAGGTATFSVVLNSQPTADVTIGIASSNLGEGTVSVASLTFTAGNWNVAQTVTVTGVDDFVDDGNVNFAINTAAASSADANYNNVDAADVAVTNVDDDVAGINVSAISGTTTEAGGTATFSVVLNSQPTADVTIGISSSNVAEGTASTSSQTFTSANWNVAQIVTITGIDDHVADGNVSFSIATAAASSADANYNNVNAADVAVTNLNDDVAGIKISAASLEFSSGTSASFTVSLTSQPTASVSIAVSTTNPAVSEVSPALLTFTAATWNVPQTITVSSSAPAAAGNASFTVVLAPAASADLSYAGQRGPSVSVVLHNPSTPTSFLALASSPSRSTMKSSPRPSMKCCQVLHSTPLQRPLLRILRQTNGRRRVESP